MAGRPRKPEGSKIIEGTFRRDRVNAKAPRPRPGIPEAPDWMPPEAQREWGRVVAEMENLGIITKLDRSDLAVYCCLFAEFVDSIRGYRTTPDGEKVAVEPMNASRIAQMRCYSTAFGFNPAAREKLSAPEKTEEKKSKWAL